VIVDTSAILALAFGEAKAGDVFDRLSGREPKRISAANLFETFAVVDRRNDRDAIRLVEESLERFSLIIESVTFEHVFVARGAWNRFGKGSGHPAGLNFGDCFAYALASVREEPLLYIGQDFIHTDIGAAM
jgi:ribonuclease VapC